MFTPTRIVYQAMFGVALTLPCHNCSKPAIWKIILLGNLGDRPIGAWFPACDSCRWSVYSEDKVNPDVR